MKYVQFRPFEKHLEASAPQHFAPIYLILAKESAERKMATDRLLQALRQGSGSTFSLKILEGESVSPQELYMELNSLSFFSDRLLLLIHQADQLKSESKELLEAEIAKSKHSLLYLVLTAETLSGATNFYKKIEKVGVVLDLNQPEKPWEKEKRMQEWLVSHASSCGKTLEPAASQALLQQVGTDFSQLQQELEKLICYVGERNQIRASDIATVCMSVNLETVWQLGEAIFQRHAADALRIGKALVSDGTAFFVLLRQIRNQFQTEYQVCSILAGGGNASDISVAFPYMKGTILNRHIQMAQGYGMPSLKRGLLEIDKTETLAKNSGIDPEVLAELLWIKLTTVMK